VKSQTDIIVSIVSIVLALIVAGVCFAMKPQVQPIAAPEQVNVSPPQYPAGSVRFSNSLPNAGQAGVGMVGGGGGARPGPGGRMSMGTGAGGPAMGPPPGAMGGGGGGGMEAAAAGASDVAGGGGLGR
jgi:hypothetical protein